ncbi:MAG: RNA polymerase-associated protein RapA [Sphingopyxis sp.]|jgi:ATP-dependent helicase HepA|nr:MAG: RNA polymerase-associated protein RapA [Sphingopyxis sp.]
MYAVGQRWISEAETDLGLGLIQSVDFRMVTVFFPAQDETRTYATDGAPLTRIRFEPEDEVPLHDGSVFTIAESTEIENIMFYSDGERQIPETLLAASIQLNSPSDRLFTGQIDNNNLFELRQTALSRLAMLRKRPYFGLLGARTSLLPHQLHIANQVTQDALPRVLLADEVGLGKTIEAGLILHRLLRLQRIQRVLILVPDHLVHQWLVEMVRRFNLHFQVVRPIDLEEDDATFSSGQLFICPLSLATSDLATAEILCEDWDVLVVDEAHHLTWTPEFQDDGYRLVDSLAQITPSVLLLTATPEQLGVEGHYARLRLLDPERYPTLENFVAEQSAYRPYAELSGAIAAGDDLSSEQAELLANALPDLAGSDDPKRILNALIDRFGPGRALYRNTRQGVAGFPKRIPEIVELDVPEVYEDVTDDLHPHHGVHNWAEADPRAAWIVDLLAEHKNEKFVLITHSVDTVLELERFLWERHGISVSVFHEHMDMVERDRAAAFFADQDQGARLLICSEIGSEGRNFQFASHLVLFDLPFNCDLIEQRIGRLDRIGQKNDIRIHIPVFKAHATSQWAHLLNDAFDCFSHPNPAAQPLLDEYREQVSEWLISGATPKADLAEIVEKRSHMQQQFEQGRDRLLELHSCPPESAAAMAREMAITHIEDEAELNDFIELFADAFGLEVTDLGGDCITIAPGDHMLVPDLPHLPEDGFMATTHRDVALSRDDVQFLSWEHPFVDQALELITSGPAGNAAAGYIESHDYKTGDCIIQLQFAARCAAPRALQLERFLPPDAMHLTMTPTGDLKVNEPELDEFVLSLKRGTARGLVEQKEGQIRPLITKLEKMGMGQLDKMIERALGKAQETYDDRRQRLVALSKHNPAISESSIKAIDQEELKILDAIRSAQLVLDSVRLVFCG